MDNLESRQADTHAAAITVGLSTETRHQMEREQGAVVRHKMG